MNFKSPIFKIFFSYLVVYFLALIFKYNYDLEFLLNNIQYKYLIALNIISIFLGLPLSIIFDFILIKLFGLYYVLFFSPALAILSVIQVLILRKIKFKFSRNILFLKNTKNNNLYKFFERVSFNGFYINNKIFPNPPSYFGKLYHCHFTNQEKDNNSKHTFGILFLLYFSFSNNC